MKSPTRDLIRNLIRLVEDDVTELRDAVVEVDERCAASVITVNAMQQAYRRLDERLAEVEAYLLAFDHDPHSRKVRP